MDTTKKSIPTGVTILSKSITEINSSGSYLINKRIEMNGDFTIPYGVTLYFEGGYIIGNGKLVGNHTRIVAPIEQIFYDAILGVEAEPANISSDENQAPIETPDDSQIYKEEITPAGTWDIDVAYPRWFGMKTITEIMAQNNLSKPTIDEDNSISMSFDIYDSSNAINRAIRMKGKGKVFIPKGRYIVTHTIFMSVGIQLCGEGGLNDGNSPFADEKDYPYTCTCIYSYPQSYYGQDHNPNKDKDKDQDDPFIPYYIYAFDENYLLKINIIKEDINNSLNYTETAAYGEKPDLYPPAGTIVSDICFSNWQVNTFTHKWIKDRLNQINTELAKPDEHKSVPRIPLIRCILAMGGFEIKNVHTYNFYNAVSCVWHYNDSKKIDDCGIYIVNKDPFELKDTYSEYLQFPISEYFEDYEHSFSAIYFHGNGDALEIERNHIDNSFAYSVNLSSCGGGVISANILNSPVKLSNNKSVIFEGNHLENGSYVYIYASNINIINNFFIKGKNPSIVLASAPDRSAPEVSLTGNQFCFIEPQEITCSTGSQNKYCWTTNEQFKVIDICDYDIGLIANIQNGATNYTSFVNAKLHQNYRYAMGALGFGTNHTFGCKIIILHKDNNGAYFIDNTNFSGKEFSDFNQHSYFLANESQLMPYNTFIGNAKIDNTNIATPLYCMRNGRTRWELEDDKMSYTYYAVPVFDMSRRIAGIKSTMVFDKTAEEISGNIDPKVISKGERGVLLSIGSELAKFKGLVNIRLYRQGSNSASFRLDMIDIPIIGNSFFYDNGISIAGFRWRDISSVSEYDRLLFSNPEIFNQNITSVKFENDNVICWAPEKPIYGTWRVNDIVYNNNKDQQAGDPIMWIYTENGWKAK